MVQSVSSASPNAKWRQDPVDPNAQRDLVGTTLRSARNVYWSAHLPPPDGAGSIGLQMMNTDDLFLARPSLWVVVTFESFAVFQPHLGDGAYTEIRLSVSQVLADHTPRPVAPGSRIDLDIVGGSLRQATGQDRHFNLGFEANTFTPGHVYLLQLQYVPKGDFFIQERAWDLTTGVAIPIGFGETEAFLSGRSLIGGLPSNEAITKAKQLLSTPPRDGAKMMRKSLSFHCSPD